MSITMTVGIAAVVAAVAVAGAALAPAALPPAHAAGGDPGTLAFKFGSHGSDYPDQIWQIRSLHVAPNGSIAVFDDGPVRDSLKVFHSNGGFSHELEGTWFSSGDHRHVPDGTGRSFVLASNYVAGMSDIDGNFERARSLFGINDVNDVAFAPDGSIVVNDWHKVHVYNPNFTLAFSFGPNGSDSSEFASIGGTAVAPNGNIYVSEDGRDPNFGPVQAFHPNGTFAYETTVWYALRGLLIGPSGEFIADTLRGVDLYYPNGSFAASINASRYPIEYGLVDIGPTGMIFVRGSSGHEVFVYHGINSTYEVPPPPPPPPPPPAAGDPGTLAFKFGSHGGEYPDQIWQIRSLHVAPNGSIVIFDDGRVVDYLKVFHPNGEFSHELDGTWWRPAGDVRHVPDGTGRSFRFDSGLVRVYDIDGNRRTHFIEYGYAGTVAPDGSIVMHGARFDEKVYVYNPNFTLAFSFGQRGPYDGEFSYIDGIAVAPNGNIYVYDRALGRVQAFHPNGTFAYKVPVSWGYVYGFLVGPSGEFLVDGPFSNGTVVPPAHLYHPNGSFAASINMSRWDPINRGLVDFGPTGTIVARGSSGYEVLVYHGINSTYEWVPPPPPPRPQSPPFYAPRAPPAAAPLSLDGADFALEFGSYGSGDGQFLGPYDVAFGPDGIIAVSDYGNHRIQVFHPNGTFAFEFGSYGSAAGQFAGPYGLAFGPDGIIAVSDYGNHRIQVFHPNGTFAFEFGSYGSAAGQFAGSYGLAFGPDNQLAVFDFGNHRVQIFRIR